MTPSSAWLVARIVLGIACFAIGAVLSVVPGPAFVFWLAGLALLGVSAGQLLLSIHAVQEFVHRHLPVPAWLPRLRKQHIRKVLRHRWVRMVDHLSGGREKRRAKRRARRRAP